jgi:hypothetical protein
MMKTSAGSPALSSFYALAKKMLKLRGVLNGAWKIINAMEGDSIALIVQEEAPASVLHAMIKPASMAGQAQVNSQLDDARTRAPAYN